MKKLTFAAVTAALVVALTGCSSVNRPPNRRPRSRQRPRRLRRAENEKSGIDPDIYGAHCQLMSETGVDPAAANAWFDGLIAGSGFTEDSGTSEAALMRSAYGPDGVERVDVIQWGEGENIAFSHYPEGPYAGN